MTGADRFRSVRLTYLAPDNNPGSSPDDHIADVQDVNTKAIVGKCKF